MHAGAEFHPAVAAWFRETFAEPTPAQQAAWPAIAAGRHTLVAAPTGSGKTLTAFLAAIDDLVQRHLAGTLTDELAVIYVSPLKALSNDIDRNLQQPLAGIDQVLQRMGLPAAGIRTAVRTGDTLQREREKLRRRSAHVLVTTPESLYVLLGSLSGRRMLSTARTVIVDEIHAVAGGKRGSHLALSLERLDALCGTPPVRIGLSATQKPIERVAAFLTGNRPCTIVDVGFSRARDLAIEVPPIPLSAVMSNDMWDQVYARLAELVAQHRTTLVFVNTRRMAERAAHRLSELLGRERVAAHHGSLSREARLDAEQRLKAGELQVLVATASLELGIDIGDVDLVSQIGSPHSIAAFLQRVGRSGHSVGGTPKGRLFPQSRDELVEAAALLDCVRRGELDVLHIPVAPLDVLAQQIVAEVACREWSEDALFDCVHGAAPYESLARADYDAVVRMLAEGYTTQRGPRAAYLHRDAVNRVLRARRGAGMTAVPSGGRIPAPGAYTVLLEPQALKVGTVHEDFAVESLAGDVFQLGNTSYRILRIEPGRMRVEDAKGAPPSIPFWMGEAPGRSDELSAGVSRLREEVVARLMPVDDDGARPVLIDSTQLHAHGQAAVDAKPRMHGGAALRWLTDELGLAPAAAEQIVDYLLRTRIALGVVPTQRQLVFERFFDESGATQLVIHSPFGSRLNRAWGLALRKRFCRKFNFELQAAAIEDAIVLSLSTTHSFALDEVVHYLHSSSARDVLVQALLDAPMFGVRWRWNATTALALPRFTGGRKVAAPLQRMRSDDLLAGVFPDQVACAENLVGEREIPQHPLVQQTLTDCLTEAMDADGWIALLRRIESGEVTVIARDLVAPSPMAAEILTARPYAFLDDAPLEERRTQAVMNRRYREPEDSDDLGRLDPQAIADVRDQAWPLVRNADELHAALMGVGWLTAAEVSRGAPPRGGRPGGGDGDGGGDGGSGSGSGSGSGDVSWQPLADELVRANRATRLTGPGVDLWVCAERLAQWRLLQPALRAEPAPQVPADAMRQADDADDALIELLRARLTALGPVDESELVAGTGLSIADTRRALLALQAEGSVMQGSFSAPGAPPQWCERHLLARIHRYTVSRLRREIEPVEPRDFMRFLFDWQRVSRQTRVNGPEALESVIQQFEGFEAPAGAWEADLLPARVGDYSIAWLDDLCTAGRITWTRIRDDADTADRVVPGIRGAPVVLLPRRSLPVWSSLAPQRGGGGACAGANVGGGAGASTRAAPPPAASAGSVRDGGESAAWGDAREDIAARAAAVPSRVERVEAFLASHGASFFDELQTGTRLLRTELEDALIQGVARGHLHCDSFAGLRALMARSSRQQSGRFGARGGRRGGLFGLEDAGRWALIRRPAGRHPDALEQVARTLLRRYGVVAWHLLDREAAWLPPWRELLRVYHRLEARGEIRGGRFIAGLAGEQFALPDAVGLLRAVRNRPADGELVCVSATDPLNLTGSVLAGDRVPRLSGARVLYRDGVPVAALVAGKVSVHGEFPAEQVRRFHDRLMRGTQTEPMTADPVAGG